MYLNRDCEIRLLCHLMTAKLLLLFCLKTFWNMEFDVSLEWHAINIPFVVKGPIQIWINKWNLLGCWCDDYLWFTESTLNYFTVFYSRSGFCEFIRVQGPCLFLLQGGSCRIHQLWKGNFLPIITFYQLVSCFCSQPISPA